MNNQQIPTSTSSPRLIAVLGCTGTVGSQVMTQLANHDCFVRGILRNSSRRYPIPHQNKPARVSYVAADHQSTAQLTRACLGVDALFLLMGTHPEQVQNETRVIEAAQRAGVRRIIKLSAPVSPESMSMAVAAWHRKIEAKLAASGIEHCSLRPYSFMQNWLHNTHSIRYMGKIYGSAGAAPRNYVDCRDVAAIATRLLLNRKPLDTQIVTITGPEAISNREVAERLSFVIGSTIRYENLSLSDYREMLLKRAKLPKWLAQHIVELEELAIQMPEQGTDKVHQLLGYSPRTMDEFLQESRSMFMRKSRTPWLFKRH